MKRNLAYDTFVMLRRTFYRQLGVLLWMKLMNGKSISQLPCVNECWLGTASKNHCICPDNNHTFPVSHAKQIPRQLQLMQHISKLSKV